MLEFPRYVRLQLHGKKAASSAAPVWGIARFVNTHDFPFKNSGLAMRYCVTAFLGVSEWR
jgi:hypothetical protein